jgi:hypothetical protein
MKIYSKVDFSHLAKRGLKVLTTGMVYFKVEKIANNMLKTTCVIEPLVTEVLDFVCCKLET